MVLELVADGGGRFFEISTLGEHLSEALGQQLLELGQPALPLILLLDLKHQKTFSKSGLKLDIELRQKWVS